MLDVARLRVLVAVAEHGSVTAAAKALNFAQPSVSHHLTRLQAETGVQLITRAGRGIRLTPEGEALAHRAVEIIGRVESAEAAPVPQRVRGQFGPVVAADEHRVAAPLGGDLVEHRHGGVGVDRPVDVDCQRFAGVLVDDVAQLEGPPVDGDVELEIDRPHVIDALSRPPVGGNGGVAQPLAFPALLRDPEAFLAPQPLNLLAVAPEPGPDGLAQCARRYPHRGRFREKPRSHARNAASGSASRGW